MNIGHRSHASPRTHRAQLALVFGELGEFAAVETAESTVEGVLEERHGDLRAVRRRDNIAAQISRQHRRLVLKLLAPVRATGMGGDTQVCYIGDIKYAQHRTHGRTRVARQT